MVVVPRKLIETTTKKIQRSSPDMATTTGPNKTELQETIDRAIEVLEDAYEPESTREKLAEAVGSAIDILNGEDEEDEDEDEEEDDLD